MPYYHFLQDVAIIWVVIVFILAFFAAGYTGAPLLVHTLLWSALLYGVGRTRLALDPAGCVCPGFSCARTAPRPCFRPGDAGVSFLGFPARDF